MVIDTQPHQTSQNPLRDPDPSLTHTHKHTHLNHAIMMKTVISQMTRY